MDGGDDSGEGLRLGFSDDYVAGCTSQNLVNLSYSGASENVNAMDRDELLVATPDVWCSVNYVKDQEGVLL